MRRTAIGMLAALLAALVLVGAQPAAVARQPVVTAGRWILQRTDIVPSATADQGMTTVDTTAGRSTLVTRGDASALPGLERQGWTHIGDPSSWRGSVLDAYQFTGANEGHGTAKLFVLTGPHGRRHEFLHALVRGEQPNNSFTAIAPGGRWFVSGEWGTMRRLLVFALPAHPAAAVTSLPLAATIRLDRPVRNVQGCAFRTPTVLLCSTDDPGRDLFGTPRQLLQITLDHAVHGSPVVGHPALVGPIPASTPCGAAGEVEGIDVHGPQLTTAVNFPCTAQTELLTYSASRAVRADPDPSTVWTMPPVPGPAETRTRRLTGR